MILFSRAEILTQRNETLSLAIEKAHITYAKMAVQMISRLAGLDGPNDHPAPQSAPRLAALPH